jgi:hypothetical protein
MSHLVNPYNFICALSTMLRCLAEASAKNTQPKGLQDIVPMALHTYVDVFSKTAFNTLPQHQKWDHSIELECNDKHNTTQTLEYTKDKYNAKIRKQRVSHKVPPDFVPGLQYMQERYEKLQLNPNGFLWPEEEKLAHHLVKEQEECLSWIEEEKGEFWQDFFPPVCILTVPHTPWVYKNIPIPPGLHNKLVKIIRDKIASSAYEPSNATYRSR